MLSFRLFLCNVALFVCKVGYIRSGAVAGRTAMVGRPYKKGLLTLGSIPLKDWPQATLGMAPGLTWPGPNPNVA